MTDQDNKNLRQPDGPDHGESVRDPGAGHEALPRRSREGWAAFMAVRETLGPMPDDFLADRRQGSETRDPFAEEPE